MAYNVTSVNGTANSYRSDGVDLEACTDTGSAGGDDIGWTAAGQWFKYTVNVATAGTYTVSLRLASPSGVTDGFTSPAHPAPNLSGNENIPATGGWQTWTTVTDDRQPARRPADPDHRPGQRRLEHPPADLRELQR